MSNVTIFRSKFHNQQIAESIIAHESELASARRKAGWDFKEGEPNNTYPEGSRAFHAYEEEFLNIYMDGLYAEQGS